MYSAKFFNYFQNLIYYNFENKNTQKYLGKKCINGFTNSNIYCSMDASMSTISPVILPKDLYRTTG